MPHSDRAVQIALSESFLARSEAHIVDAIVGRARMWDIPAGRVFINQDTLDRCGLIVSGMARVYAVKGDGAHATIRRVARGAAVGVRAMVGDSNALHVRAITDVEFMEIDPRVLMSVAANNAALAWAIAREVGDRLRDTETVLEAAVHGSVTQRVAGALLDLAGDANQMEILVSHEGLAELVGASRERVGQALRMLDASGALAHSRRRITIVDPALLQAEATHHGNRIRHSGAS